VGLGWARWSKDGLAGARRSLKFTQVFAKNSLDNSSDNLSVFAESVSVFAEA
jgi:hypothetical protein